MYRCSNSRLACEYAAQRNDSKINSALEVAREHNHLVSVRGGGHSIAGKAGCDGGLMVDLSAMKGIRVDPLRRTVRTETGFRCLRTTQLHTDARHVRTPGRFVYTKSNFFRSLSNEAIDLS